MSTNHEFNGEDEIQAARRTAHALGQTQGAERGEVAAEMAASPQVYQEVEEVEALAARLKKAAHEAPQPEPSPALREAVERRLAELEATAGRVAVPAPVEADTHGDSVICASRAAGLGPTRPWWRNRLAALALTAACLVALAVPILWSTGIFGPEKEPQLAGQTAGEYPPIAAKKTVERPKANTPADEALVPTSPTRGPARENGISSPELAGNGSNIYYDVNSLRDRPYGKFGPQFAMERRTVDGVAIGGTVLAVAWSVLPSFAAKDLQGGDAGHPWFAAAVKGELGGIRLPLRRFIPTMAPMFIAWTTVSRPEEAERLAEALHDTPGGRNLAALGLDEDILAAARIDRFTIVPELDPLAFRIRGE